LRRVDRPEQSVCGQRFAALQAQLCVENKAQPAAGRSQTLLSGLRLLWRVGADKALGSLEQQRLPVSAGRVARKQCTQFGRFARTSEFVEVFSPTE
jgi:hypothetical protein